jgi:molybdopterin molybdotransferase
MEFISYQSALEKILQKVPSPHLERIGLGDSLHYMVAEDVVAPMDIPVFDNAAMDGFGFMAENVQIGNPYAVVGEIKAGTAKRPKIKIGEAVKILTGAPVPPDIDVVVPKENCVFDGSHVTIMNGHWEKGSNIRLKGTQTKQGEIIVQKRTMITPGVIGMLATFGIASVSVYSRPKTGILITGDELVPAGKPLKPGQIYESNSHSLQALLKSQHIEPVFIRWVPDNLALTASHIMDALDEVDLLLITGGISVSDYDFAGRALQAAGVETIFYKIRQKPGKPMFFGSKGNKVVFSLPGNPAAVFTCFHVYIRPFIQAYSSDNLHFTDFEFGKLKHDFHKKTGLTHWLKAIESNGDIEILSDQESYKMNAFVQANCLACMDDSVEYLQKGSDIIFIKF